MEPNESPVSQEGGISNMEEFLQAVRDIQSIDIDKLRIQFPQFSKHTSTDVSDTLMPHTAHALESQRRETPREQLEEEARFREEYFKVFGGKEMKDLIKMIDDMKDNIKRLKEEKTKLEEKNKSLEEEKRKAKAENDNVMTRSNLRKENQMTDNNEDIGDLSDQNTISKLGDRYTKLYDSHWLNAFEVLTETHEQNEENAIQILLNILTECHNFVKMRADEQINDLVQRISSDPTIQVGEDIKRHLRTTRKLLHVTRDGVLFQECENHVQDVMGSAKIYLYEKEMKCYLIECFQLCWLMVIQDPPVVFGKEAMKRKNFDPDLYKYYSRSGKLIEFEVLPPLYLHEGGALLAQGVAQPILETRRETTTIEKQITKSSSSTLAAPPDTSVSKTGDTQSALNPSRETDTGYQMQPVKTSYTETNFAWNQDQNATSQYENSGDPVSVGKSGNYSQETKYSDSINQHDWSYVKSTYPSTIFQTRGTEHGYEPVNDTERVLYELFVRILKENGEELARKCYPRSCERYQQTNKSDASTFA